MEGKPFLLGEICLNLTSYQKLARHYKEYIDTSMRNIEEKLNPTVTEDEELVRRATFFVRNGAVSIANYSLTDNRIDFVIRDVTNIEVKYLPMVDLIHCPCQMQKPCRHIVAAVFYLYQQNFSLSDWVSNWKSNSEHLQLSLLSNERDPKNWDLIIDNFFRKFISSYPPTSFYLLEFAIHDLEAQVRKSRPFEREWQPIFDVYVKLGILQRAWFYFNEYAETNMRNRVYQFLTNYLEDLDESLSQLAAKPRMFAADPFYDRMMENIRSFYYEEEGLIYYRKHIYLAFWDALVSDKATRMQEVKYLQELTIEEDGLMLNMVLPYFYLTLSMIDELLEAAENMDRNQLLEWVEVSEKALHTSNKDLVNELTRKLLPHISYYLTEVIQHPAKVMLIRRLQVLFNQVNLTTEELEKLYLSFGLYGIQAYSGLLIEQKRYKEWMALHQATNSSLEYTESCGLAVVREEAPDVLLPLYHHYAMRYIQEKNRYSYKQAVRVWKKMKQVAKKANEIDYWNAYVESVREKYRRLRALQQEIEKGNLPL